MPIIDICILWRFKDKLKDEEIEKKYGSIYQGLRLRHGKPVLFEPSVGLIRILLFSFSMIFLGEYRYFQIFAANFLTTFVIIYNGLAEPFEEKSNNFF